MRGLMCKADEHMSVSQIATLDATIHKSGTARKIFDASLGRQPTRKEYWAGLGQWKPVANSDIINMVHEKIVEVYPQGLFGDGKLGVSWECAAGQMDHNAAVKYRVPAMPQQFFAVCEITADVDGLRAMIALRGSFNKSLARAFAAGLSVFACSNLMMDGSGYHETHKHTSHAMPEIESKLHDAVVSLESTFESQYANVLALKENPIGINRGYELIGLARGTGVLNPQQTSRVIHDWDCYAGGATPKSQYENAIHMDAFEGDTAWTLSNCMTEAAKDGPAGAYMRQHDRVSQFVSAALLAA